MSAATPEHTVSDVPITAPRDPLSLASRFAIPIALIVAIAVFTSLSPNFLSFDNAQNILRQSSVIGIAAVGLAIVLIAGGIDISQGAVVVVSGLLLVNGLNAGIPTVVILVLCIGLGAMIGFANGFFAEKIRLPALMATLGVALVVRGLAFVWTEGTSIAIDTDNSLILWLGRGELGPVPAPFVVLCVVTAVASVALRRTVWGRHIYAIGGNAQAARASGISVVRSRWIVYMIGASASALAGVVLASRLTSAAPNAVPTMEFDVITAAVLGGVSIYGGIGSVGRVLLAAVFLATLANGLVQLNVPTFWVRVVTGLVFLAALTIDRLKKNTRDES